MCSSWGVDYIEHCLGLVWVYPEEDLLIEVSVLNEDNQLAKTNPTLRIVGKHDSAVFSHPILLIKRVIFILAILALIVVNLYAWRKVKK